MYIQLKYDINPTLNPSEPWHIIQVINNVKAPIFLYVLYMYYIAMCIYVKIQTAKS